LLASGSTVAITARERARAGYTGMQPLSTDERRREVDLCPQLQYSFVIPRGRAAGARH
jgi:hypothetical protein